MFLPHFDVFYNLLLNRGTAKWNLFVLYNNETDYYTDILGDPGGTSQNDAIFSGESLLQELKSPWELILTEPVPEVVEFRPADWAEKYFFCPISDEV